MAKNDKMEAQKEAKLKALDDAIAHIEKQYGKGSVMKRVLGVILGSCLYRFIVAIALRFNVPAECLKLVSAIIVAVAISLPYLKQKAAFAKTKREAIKKRKAGGGY